MRPLQVVVAGESVVVIVLAICWLVGLDRGPMLAVPGDSQTAAPGHDAAAANAAVAADAASSDGGAAAVHRTRVASGGGADVILRGRLLRQDGAPGPADANIVLRREDQWRSATVVDGGAYAIADLQPGSWAALVRSDDFVSIDTVVELTDEPLQTRDFVLTRAQRVDVFLRTPDGKQLEAAIPRGVPSSSPFVVLALAEPWVGELPATETRSFVDIGVGRYQRAWYQPGRKPPGPDDPDGTLLLDRPAPLTALLVFGRAILEQRTIAPGQTQITFVLALDSVFERTATVRLRVVDGDTGGPISGVRVSLGTSQAGNPSLVAAQADGAMVIEHVPSGRSWLSIEAKGRETVIEQVCLRPGETVDLGEFRLFAPPQIRGTLSGPDGKPVGGSVCWTDVDTMTRPRSLIQNRMTRADGDGAFQLYGAGPRRLVVTAHDGNGRVGYTFVDARNGVREPVQVRLSEPVEIVISASDPLAFWFATVRDQAGTPVAAAPIEPRRGPVTLQVPPGDYTLELHANGERLVKTVPIAARSERIRVEVP